MSLCEAICFPLQILQNVCLRVRYFVLCSLVYELFDEEEFAFSVVVVCCLATSCSILQNDTLA